MPTGSGKKFFITTAIDYANSTPHLGTAYEKIGADVIARYRRLRGDDVYFLMGNDEHSLNVEKRARELGKDPQAYCDEMAERFEATWRRLEISYDRFIRTTDEVHKNAVRKFLQAIYDNGKGDIYKGHYEGWYCVSCEAFYQEKDLAGGNCPTHGTKPEWIREQNWFFKLSKFQDQLIEYITKKNPGFIQPEMRRNEILNVIRGGLQDVSISRAGVKWGIPLPFDDWSVAYVWVDALINYITGAGYGTDEERFRKTWPADVHVIGKDITRFHCIIWPALLWSAGLEPPLKVHAHGFVNLQGAKMSKTLGTVLDPVEVAEKVGVDALRYFLMAEVPFDRDGDFTWERVQDRCNADLANGIGNLLARTTAMIVRYQVGIVRKTPTVREASESFINNSHMGDALEGYRRGMDEMLPSRALEQAWRIVAALDSFIAARKPFQIAKDPARADEVADILYVCAETLRILAILIQPVMPGAAASIWSQLGLPGSVDAQRIDSDLDFFKFPEQGRVTKGDPLFPRLEILPPVDAK
ncbi:MAG: methionine--tRNA ligase [Deltaproteobacteria bacterium]|nr:methionine--tRNA ligase [Deltaproteobacteria bacterium]